MSRLRMAFVLPGLHRVARGAEVAFESVARELALRPEFEITLLGSGTPRPADAYRFIHVSCTPREKFERWPHMPVLRHEYAWEDLTFVAGLRSLYRPTDYDVTLTCNYPFSNWFLRARGRAATRPAHIFVTQNGDWPAQRFNAEYRWFGCDGVVCINTEYYERHRVRYACALIPNGVDVETFRPGSVERAALGLPEGVPLVLIASALIPSKRVIEGLRAVARLPEAHLVVAGDGPLRDALRAEAERRMPGRLHQGVWQREQMPLLYRACDALLHMSQIEPFGNVLVEALACGRPVVAHARPVARWILEDQARLVDTDSPEAVATAVHDAIEDSCESAAAARHAYVRRRFAWPEIARQYGEFARNVVLRVQKRRGAVAPRGSEAL